MKIFTLSSFLISSLVLVACSTREPSHPSGDAGKLDAVCAAAEARAPYRDGIPVFEISPGVLDNGNSWLFGGLLCLSGYYPSCRALHDSLRAPDGRIRRPCRAPWRVTPSGCSDTENSFSRDEVVGMAAYLVATGDEAVIESLKLADANLQLTGNAVVKDTVLLGAEPSLWPRVCDDADDSRCLLSPSLLGLLSRICQHERLDCPASWSAGKLVDDSYLLLAAKTTQPGFRLHLVAVQLLLRSRLPGWNTTLNSAIRTLVQRQPSNPLFRYISGQDVSSQLPGLWAEVGPRLSQYAWQRDVAEKAWKDSTGWDFGLLCRFLGVTK
jgi:hypothetical protein